MCYLDFLVFDVINKEYYELLPPRQIVTGDLYSQQFESNLKEKTLSNNANRWNVILLYDNISMLPYVAVAIKEILFELDEKVAPDSPQTHLIFIYLNQYSMVHLIHSFELRKCENESMDVCIKRWVILSAREQLLPERIIDQRSILWIKY